MHSYSQFLLGAQRGDPYHNITKALATILTNLSTELREISQCLEKAFYVGF